MSTQSTITLPIVVEDQKAIAELKKIQSQLGAVGQESVALNKRIAGAMDALAAKAGSAFGDIRKKTEEWKSSIAGVKDGLEVAGKIVNTVKAAVETAKFADEFSRLERAVPVEKFKQLQRETQGTVSKFDLLQRAAKEMGLSATAGMDETGRALRRTLTDWENFFDGAKRALGSFLGSVITGLDRLSDRLAGVDSTFEDQARRNLGGDSAIGQMMVSKEAASAEEARLLRQQGQIRLRGLRKRVADDNTRILTRARMANIQGESQKAFDASLWSQSVMEDLTTYGSGWNTGESRSGRGGGRGGQGRGGGWNPFGDFAQWSKGASGDMFTRNARSLGAGFGSFLAPGEGGMFDGIGDKLGQKEDDVWGIDARVADFEKQAKAVEDMQAKFGGAFQGFSNAIGAAVDAAITGSDSIGKAFLKASASALKALAVESGVRAAYNTAMGIGSLAIGSPKAGEFFAAAAQFAAVTALAGGGAAVLNAVGGGGGARAGAGGGSARDYRPVTGAREEGGTQNITVNVSVGAAADAGKLGELIDKSVSFAKRQGRTRSEQNVVVRYE